MLRAHGFTLVEIMIVIAIIGILAALVIVAFNGVQRRAHIAMLVSDLSNAAARLKVDQVDLGGYPATAAAADSGKGLKASPGTTYQYTVDNSANPQTFCLTGINGDLTYNVTQSTPPTEGACPGHLAAGMVASASDNFNRTASTLGTVPSTNLAWTALSGTWSTNGSVATTSATPSSNPLATIDFSTGDVDESVNISTGGGDALILRASDASNYIRARYYMSSTYVSSGYWSGWHYNNYPNQWSADSNGCGLTLGGMYYSNTSTQQYTYQQIFPSQVAGTDCGSDGDYVYMTREWTDNSYYTYNYYVYLEKVVNGTATTLYTANVGTGVSKLRLLAKGQSISLYINGSSTASTTVNDTFNQTATKHGIGRGPTSSNGSAIDNYTITRS